MPRLRYNISDDMFYAHESHQIGQRKKAIRMTKGETRSSDNQEIRFSPSQTSRAVVHTQALASLSLRCRSDSFCRSLYCCSLRRGSEDTGQEMSEILTNHQETLPATRSGRQRSDEWQERQSRKNRSGSS